MVKLNNIYRLKNIIRYSNVNRITNENVSEHSFFVAAILFELIEIYDFDLGKAIQMAIVHDMPEIYIDDINHTVKRDYPKVAQALKEAEAEIVREKFSPTVAAVYTEYEEQKTTEAKIVKLADIIQCKQYASYELSLGNSGYMQKVYDESLKLIAEKEKELIYAKKG